MLTKEKRVAVAKDAIKHANSNKFRLHEGSYLHTDFSERNGLQYYQIPNAQKFFKRVKRCNVCAKGGLFVSSVCKFNEFKFKKIYREVDELNKKVVQDWGEKQADLIECAFELWNKAGLKDNWGRRRASNFSAEEIDKAKEFGRKHRSAKKRFIAICKNIIKNNGTFKP